MKIAGIENYEIEGEYKGKALEGIVCRHPFLDRESKVVLGTEDSVNVELGTWCCCPNYNISIFSFD